MTAQEKLDWFADAYGYICYCINEGIDASETMTNLMHDITGIAKDDTCFCPQLSGYGKHTLK